MKSSFIFTPLAVALLIVITTYAAESANAAEDSSNLPVPVLVELFTSEGCSSCPPADRLLQKLDQQPVAGAQLIVLSEHVDYWNHIGWRDPYSAAFYSSRQSAYGDRFDLGSVYTPQMVVDGESQFVGNDPDKANRAFAKAVAAPKLKIAVSSVAGSPGSVSAHIETGSLDSALSSHDAEVFVAVALNHAEQQVSRGENSGRRLTHVSVVRSLTKVGVIRAGEKLDQNVEVKLEPGVDLHNLRLVAFVQEPHQGKVLGAAVAQVGAP